MKALRIGLGWSADDSSNLSCIIRHFTRPKEGAFWALGQWSHMFLIFELENHTTEIHEALLGEGWTRKCGDKLVHWMNEDQKNHHSEIHWLPLDLETINQIYTRSCARVGLVSYAIVQLIALTVPNSWLGRKLKWDHTNRKLPGIICSEEASEEVAFYAPEWDLRTDPNEPFDYLSPQEAYDNYLVKEAAHAH